MFLVLAIPAVYLYGERPRPGPRPASFGPGRRVHSVFGLIFVPLALLQFVDLIGGNPTLR